MPPQLMPPPIRLPASDSLRFRLTLSRFWLFMEMGLGPALTKESCRLRPMPLASRAPVVMLTSGSQSARSSSAKAEAWEVVMYDDEGSSHGGVTMEAGRDEWVAVAVTVAV